MKKLFVLALAACLAIASPISAYAATVATAAAMPLSATSSYSDVVGSLPAPGNATLDLTKVKATANVSIVKLSTLKGYKANALKLSVADTATMKNIDAKVMANAALSAKLKAAGDTPEDVIAVSTDASGGVTLFVNK